MGGCRFKEQEESVGVTSHFWWHNNLYFKESTGESTLWVATTKQVMLHVTIMCS
jgi:hypothetical protein